MTSKLYSTTQILQKIKLVISIYQSLLKAGGGLTIDKNIFNVCAAYSKLGFFLLDFTSGT